MKDELERIEHDGELLAIIISANFNRPGVNFFTPRDLSQQLAFMRHGPGKVIDAHVHNPVPRNVQYTQEVLIIRQGKLRVDFYDRFRNYLESRILGDGDVLMLVSGGHGFEVLEETEMFEVKQGPYEEDRDKTRFGGITSERAVIKGSSR